MKRPKGLPTAEHYPHGARARYVAGCRCGECKGANRQAYHDRQARAKELAEQITTEKADAPQVWTAPDGTKKVRIYKRACPGVNGKPCPHGSHLRKDSKGGVCGRCRLQLDWNGLVSATPARKHLRKLSRQGVGYKMVAEAACVSITVTDKIRTGKKKHIRAKTEKRILEVDAGAVADHGRIDAKETQQLLKEMLEAGYTKTDLAGRLGSKAKVPALQLLKTGKVTAKNAQKVRKLHKEITRELDWEKRGKYLCTNCGRSHKKKDRLEFLKKNLPRSSEQLKGIWPCAYDGIAGDRALYRDLNELYAEADRGVWRLPIGLTK